MKKYEYVNLNLKGFFSSESTEHRKIIDEYAQKGYRYVGYIPVKIDSCGLLREMDLVFEKDC